MQKALFLAAVLFVMNGLYAQKTIIHDPNAEVRKIGNFSAINISSGINLYLSQDEQEGVAVSAAETRYRERIKTVVENGVLKIWADDMWKMSSGNKKMIAYVSFKTLNKLSASGASDVYVNGILKGDELMLRLSGASDFKGSVDLHKLNIDQSGASDATISGKASTLEVDAGGASELKGYNLETDNCKAKASGASDIKITVSKELSATASGASSIYYKGTAAAKEVRSSGASNINKKG